MNPSLRLALAVLVAAVVAAAGAATARAAGPEVGVTDDRVLLAGGAAADRVVGEWRAQGVEVVRIFALWSRIAPAPGAAREPAGFDAADPGSPGYQWWELDQAVGRVRSAGMKVMLTVSGPGPLWTSRSPGRHNPRYRPDPAKYADFAHAVALRYGGDVDRYVLWNEPNLPSWLQPQAACAHRHCTPVAPHLYRGLVRAAAPAVKAADPGAQVLIGAMSSRGQDLRARNSTLRPLVFLRALGCVSSGFGKLRTGDCKHFTAARADGFAFHPHGTLLSPDRAYSNRDDVNLASLGRLEADLDRLQRAGRLHPTTRRFDLYLDEYGYQTRPPDRTAGVSLGTQDVWLQKAAYRAWRDPRVKLLTQYQWYDEPLRRAGSNYAGWQSGLRFVGGKAKPALAHFDTPMQVDAARSRLWGQARAGGAQTVTVERRSRGAKRYVLLAHVRTDTRGYWTLKRRLTRGARYRFRTAAATSASFAR
ncbi:MAG: hypothetical protein QOK35_3466 [Pseudonocardiales bacterium]|nr:hypothetical protein [Pseudonocardiales bacterium]